MSAHAHYAGAPERKAIDFGTLAILGTLLGGAVAGAWATTADVVALIRRAINEEAALEREIADMEQRAAEARQRLAAIRSARMDVERAT